MVKLTYIFAMVKNIKTTEYGKNSIHDLPTGQSKNFGYMSDYSSKLLKLHFLLFYEFF